MFSWYCHNASHSCFYTDHRLPYRWSGIPWYHNCTRLDMLTTNSYNWRYFHLQWLQDNSLACCNRSGMILNSHHIHTPYQSRMRLSRRNHRDSWYNFHLHHTLYYCCTQILIQNIRSDIPLCQMCTLADMMKNYSYNFRCNYCTYSKDMNQCL